MTYKFTDSMGLSPKLDADGNLRCNLACRAKTGWGLSKRDIVLLQWHVANGTALGYTFSTGVGRPVTASEQRITVRRYSKENAYGGKANYATFSAQLSDDATQVAQTVEQNFVAYTKNRDLALKSSKAFVMAVDEDNIEIAGDVLDLFVERSYGNVAKDGMVVLPDSITGGATSASISGSISGDGGSVGLGLEDSGMTKGYANTAILAARTANEQRMLLNDLMSPDGQERENFIQRNINAMSSLTFWDKNGNRLGSRAATREDLGIIFDNAVTRGNHAAVNQLIH